MRVIGDYLAFQYQYPDRIRSIIPETKVANGWIGVPHTLQNSTVLRNIGLPAPSPIRSQYNWPGKYSKPFDHQIATSEFATLNKRAFILNGLGSGKTLSALWAADYLKTLGIINRVLIVSPLSTLDVVWGREIFTNFPNRSYSMVYGSSDKRKKLLSEPADYYIINHHGVGIVEEELKKRPDINLIILDEAACYRNSQTKMWKTLKHIITPECWVWGMTGSPTPQSPTDAYGIAKLIRPENISGSFTRFKGDIMLQVGPFRWVPRKNAEQAVAKVLAPAIRFALRDCIDLPPTIMQYRQVELTAEQRTHYNKLLKDCVTEIRGVQITAVNAAVLLGRLIAAAGGVIYGTNHEIVKMDFSHRLAEIIEIIEASDEKVIIFAELTGLVKVLYAKLGSMYKCELLYGDVSKTERKNIFDRIQFGDSKCLIGSPSTMAHGITLTAAATIIWAQPTTKAEIYEQANARIVRNGQTKVTNIIHLISTKEEEKIIKGLQEKKKFADTVLDITGGG